MGIKVIVIGGGISGLSLGDALMDRDGIDVTVLESKGRVGGKVWSEKTDGFICEGGVNGFLDNKPGTLELAEKLKLEAYKSSDYSRKRFIYSGGKLNRLPESPPAFLKSSLVSILGKLRLAMEPFIPPRKASLGEESLADFGRRRLGREAFEKLIDPMASGIYAGDPEKLSLRHCFPRIHNIEQTYGSLIKGMIKLMAERKKTVSAGPGGTLTSFEGGLQDMTESLRARLAERIKLSAEVVSVDKLSISGYKVYLADGTSMEADAVALACPAYSAAKILSELERSFSDMLKNIYYPPLTVVCTGFKKDRMSIPLDAFGFLIPSREKRKILGTLYDSSVFPNRAPEGMALLRSMTGGARAPEVAEMEDGKLGDLVLGELKTMTGLKAEPDFMRFYRHEHAIPQYGLGHGGLIEAVESLEGTHSGLYLTGNAFRGVSFNDCIANSVALADRIAKELI